MAFSTTAKNQALDGIDLKQVSLHSGDPGTTGANLIAGGGKQAATFNAAGSGERVLNADVAFSSLGANQTVTYFGAWDTGGTNFLCGAALTGDQAANSAGEYTLKATTTKVTAS